MTQVAPQPIILYRTERKARKPVKVELFATGLQNPSHMEWTLDGRLLIAWGLQRIGGMKYNPVDGRLYAVQPEHGSVVAIDPTTSRNYRFEPPVVQGLQFPTCVRFSQDGETMYVCSLGEGVVWRVTNFLD